MKGIILDRDGDLLVEKGGIEIGEVGVQTAGFLLEAMRGEFREYPLLGLEAPRLLGGNGDPFFVTRAKKMLEHCRIKVRKVQLIGNNIIIE